MFNPKSSLKRYRLAWACVIFLASSFFILTAYRVHLWDCDEAWYAQSSRQMLQSGDWVIPRVFDQLRTAKPILIYWCQATSMKFFGFGELAVRLPSVVAMILVCLIVSAILARSAGWPIAFYWLLVFSTCPLVMNTATAAIPDALQLLFITLAQLSLLAIYFFRDEFPLAPPMLWISVGLAGLTKGPMVLAVLLVTMIALAAFDFRAAQVADARSRLRHAIGWWRFTRPLLALIIVPLVLAPWLIAAYHRNPEFLRQLLHEPFRHTLSNQSGGHPNFPGYYLVTIIFTFFPWTLILPIALVHGWRNRQLPKIRFALATIIGNFVFLECMRTKLPHYYLPAYSSLAFLVARAILAKPRINFAAIIWGIFFALLMIAMSLAVWYPAIEGFSFSRSAALTVSITGILYALTFLFFWIRRDTPRAACVMGFGFLLPLLLLSCWYLPRADFVRYPKDIGMKLTQVGATEPADVSMLGISLYEPWENNLPAPSLAYYQGGTIRQRDDDFLTTHSPSDWPKWIVITDRIYDHLSPSEQSHLITLATFRGVNYNIPFGNVEVRICRKKVSATFPQN